MAFSYANPTSGPSAGGIGWFNFNNLSLTPGQTINGLSGVLKDGSKVTFDISSVLVSGTGRNFTANTTPTFVGAFFGTSNYTGILGKVALSTNVVFAPGSTNLVISNISVIDSNGNQVPNYSVLIADAETTGITERWTYTTNGGNWSLFTTIGNSSSPTLTGIGTTTASFIGNQPVNQNAYVLATVAPTNLTLNSNTTSASGGSQAVAIGFAVTKLKIVKNVGNRINSADQFILNIGGTPNSQATTTGSADGIQTVTADIYAAPGNTYTISEAMAPSSVSALSQYTIVTSAANATPSGTIPSTGTMPLNFTAALGDNVTYNIINAAPETFSKSVNKANADIGDVLTYTVTVNNPNNFTINNVSVSDATPIGTTYLGNLTVSAPFTGIAPSTGITITSIGANDSVFLTWQVQVNSVSPIQNPINNFASVVVPGGTSGVTNVTSTAVSHAFVAINKTVDKANANIGDTLTYTITLNNVGNVAANNVVISDPIPTGTSYIAGSVAGSVPFNGTPASGINLTAPISAGGSATITYKVIVGNIVPTINPIPNTAALNYTYTVDPASPNGVTVAKASNTVTTQISTASLNIVKNTDKVISYIGDNITYQLAITNTGNVPTNNVVISEPIPNGTIYVPGSISSNVAFSGSPMTAITLTNAIAAEETVSIAFQIKVTAIPNPNPIINVAKAAFTYTVNPQSPDGVIGTSASNTISTVVFKNNYSQQISDLIESIALEEAAIGNIANAEGAKIQKMLSLPGVSTNQLLCLNKSVSETLESLISLESVLKQKLSSVECQINPTCL